MADEFLILDPNDAPDGWTDEFAILGDAPYWGILKVYTSGSFQSKTLKYYSSGSSWEEPSAIWYYTSGAWEEVG